jgi:hypothetical protein
MLMAVSALLALTLVLLGVLAYWSPGQPAAVLDENGQPVPGSVAARMRVTINPQPEAGP